jgi:RNA polymerase sigma-70 factor (ECF subfamily)
MKAEIAARLAARQKKFLSFLQARLGDRAAAAVRLHRVRAALRDKLKLVCGACARHGCLDCGCPKGPTL